MARYSDDDYKEERVVGYIFTRLAVLVHKPYRLFFLALFTIYGIWNLETFLAKKNLVFLVPTSFLITTFLLTALLLAVARWMNFIKQPLYWPLFLLLLSMVINHLFIVSNRINNLHITSIALLTAMVATLTSLSYRHPKKLALYSEAPIQGWPFAWHGAGGLALMFAAFSWAGTVLFWFNIAFVSLVLAEVAKQQSVISSMRSLVVPGAILAVILLPIGATLFGKVFGKPLAALRSKRRLASIRKQ